MLVLNFLSLLLAMIFSWQSLDYFTKAVEDTIRRRHGEYLDPRRTGAVCFTINTLIFYGVIKVFTLALISLLQIQST